ncbi:MAG TPA: threonine ammonia-lyase [Bryobacteraceae bacterium]|jgi:threonine dehydratase|nr:threonine ammonia-lyase [Bryobacteraceae bacterium]
MISLADIQAARARIRDSILFTPAPYSETLSRHADNTLYLKMENLHMTGSFKERGALNRILLMTDDERARGVITASAGNHAQAVAYHASKRGIRVQICMPVLTPLVKVTATRGYGAEVILHGNNFDEAVDEARRRCDAEGLVFLHAFNDDAVIAGQGTIGLELLEQVPDLEAVVVPVGGGGLIGGIACAIKEQRPDVHMVGVETSRVPSMQAALLQHHPVLVPPASTIADGIAVRQVGALTYPLFEKYVDEIVTVEEEEIAMAILWLLEKEKTLAEGAGAAGMAAMLNKKTSLKGKKVVVLICGGNIDVTVLARIIERGLVKDGRLVRLRVPLPDHPGGLNRLTTLVAQQRANVVTVTHDRAYFGVHLGDTIIDITMETRGPDHIVELMDALTKAGYEFERVL